MCVGMTGLLFVGSRKLHFVKGQHIIKHPTFSLFIVLDVFNSKSILSILLSVHFEWYERYLGMFLIVLAFSWHGTYESWCIESFMYYFLAILKYITNMYIPCFSQI